MRNKLTSPKWYAIAVLALFMLILGQQSGILEDVTSVGEGAESAEIRDQDTNNSAKGQVSELDGLAVEALPAEALATLERIDSNAEHPYAKDGSVFQNREGLLPTRDLGHYSEYTVKTPGEATRGARRIVAGADGERYYTADHYRSFKKIVR